MTVASGGQGGALVVNGWGWGAVPDHRGLDDCDGPALKLVVDFQLADDQLLTGSRYVAAACRAVSINFSRIWSLI
jgi:hypothetical protein